MSVSICSGPVLSESSVMCHQVKTTPTTFEAVAARMRQGVPKRHHADDVPVVRDVEGLEDVIVRLGRRSEETGAQVLFRKLPLGLVMAYIPRGPVGGGGGPDVSAEARGARGLVTTAAAPVLRTP